MPEETIETEQEQMAADARFVRGSTASTASVSTASATRSPRATVLLELVEGPMPPEEMGEATSLGTGPAHRAMNTLRDRGLAELLVPPEASDGPIFDITMRGEKAVFYLKLQANS